MGWLDSVFGGGSGSNVTYTTQSTSSSPWEPQQQYLKDVFGKAQSAYNSGNPSYFPETTVVGYSPETQQALSQVQNIATGDNPMMDAAQTAINKTVVSLLMLLIGYSTPVFSAVFAFYYLEAAPGEGVPNPHPHPHPHPNPRTLSPSP